MEVQEAHGALHSIRFVKAASGAGRSHASDQLHAYFQGKRREFDLPLVLEGTPFQKAVWEELQNIPFGQTVSYSDIAERIGKPTAYRAVANAIGANPLPVIIPCHRVTAKNGLGGYSGGIAKKRWLLRHEGLTPKK